MRKGILWCISTTFVVINSSVFSRNAGTVEGIRIRRRIKSWRVPQFLKVNVRDRSLEGAVRTFPNEKGTVEGLGPFRKIVRENKSNMHEVDVRCGKETRE